MFLFLAGAGETSTAGAPVKYKITTQTSDIRGAGSDADVELTVYGSKGDTGRLKLDNSANNFERGQLDTFFIDVSFRTFICLFHTSAVSVRFLHHQSNLT